MPVPFGLDYFLCKECLFYQLLKLTIIIHAFAYMSTIFAYHQCSVSGVTGAAPSEWQLAAGVALHARLHA